MEMTIPGLRFNLQRFSDEGGDTGFEEYTSDFGSDDVTADQPEPFGGEEAQTEAPAETDYSKFLEEISNKAKYNKEPLQVSSFDELIEKVQKGANYDKIYEAKTTLEQEIEAARNSREAQFAKTLAERYGYDSFDAYEQAVKESWEREELDNLIQQNIPEQYAKEMLENRKFREQLQGEQQAKQQQEQQNAMYNEFFSEFPDVKADTIPAEVWDMVAKGRDLTSAYALHQVKNMDSLKVSAQQEAIKAMKQNAETSTGSISDATSTEETSMSVDQVNQLLGQMSTGEQSKWIDKNIGNLEKWGYFKKF